MSESTSAPAPLLTEQSTETTAQISAEPTSALAGAVAPTPAPPTVQPTETSVMSAVPLGSEPAVSTQTPTATSATAPTEVPPVTEPTRAEATKEDPEPQNPLTKRFTEQEWDALKKFRAILPEILAAAFPDDPHAKETPINIWGVTINPDKPKDSKVSVVLMKFLRARNLSVSEAKDMLVNTLRWRKQFDIEAALKEEFPEDLFGQLGHLYGRDKEGRPVVYNVYGEVKDNKAVFGDLKRFMRWRVALMERSVILLDFREIDQTLQIHDYKGVSFTSRDSHAKAAASEASNVFQSHYPELLYRKFFINVPSVLNWLFWFFKGFISPKTVAKMTVVGTGHYAIKKALLPLIDAKELPTKYGGDAEGF